MWHTARLDVGPVDQVGYGRHEIIENTMTRTQPDVIQASHHGPVSCVQAGHTSSLWQ